MNNSHASRTRTLWALLCGGLLALLWFAPAQWLAQAVQSLSHQHVQLRQVRGTVWNGSAQWVLASGSGGRDALALPQRVHGNCARCGTPVCRWICKPIAAPAKRCNCN